MRITQEDKWTTTGDGYRLSGHRFKEIGGPVLAWQGIVEVSQSAGWSDGPWGIVLEFVTRGIHFHRVIKRAAPYSQRYLVTLARKFAEEKHAEAWRD